MATPYLAISDGTTSCVFLNSTTPQAYFIEANQWAPTVAGLRKSEFGVVGTHDDVTEEIGCRIIGTTAADCYSKLQILTNLLEQAERLSNGESVTAVLLQFAPTGSALSSDSAPLQAMILGRDEGDETSGVALQPEWDGAALNFHLPVTIRFKRRGLWTHATEAITASANTVPAVATCTFAAAHATPCPIKVQVAACKLTGADDLIPGTLIMTDSGNITLVEAESMANGGTSTSATDATFQPSSNVLQHTAVGNTAATTSHPTYNGQPIVLIAKMRGSADAQTWKITPQYGNATFTTIASAPPAYFTSVSTSAATVVFPAFVPPQNSGTRLRFLIELASAVWSTETFRMDFFYMVRVDQNTRIIHNPTTYLVANTSTGNLVLDPHILDATQPRLQWEVSSALSQYIDNQGELFFASKAAAVTIVWLPNQTYYTSLGPGAGQVVTTITATRYKSYLTPQ